MSIFVLTRGTWSFHFLFNYQQLGSELQGVNSFFTFFAVSLFEHTAHVMAVIYFLMHQIYFCFLLQHPQNHFIKVSLTQRPGYNSGIKASKFYCV